MSESAPVLPGETLAGKYRVEKVLGEGGMGIVVAARHKELDERVAIKFLLGTPSDEAVERFLREARVAAKVKGEHVCRVFDFGRLDTGEPYIVMEHLEGIDLARKLAKEGRQSVASVVGWMLETCDAIAEAHALGIVHRDLKPANVFLATRSDGAVTAKVLDFGISKLPSQQMTRTAARMGSPAYMSPEQMESSRDVDARSDVWSLGAMLYELLAGVPPFVADSLIQLTVMIREQEPPSIDGIPEHLAKVVAKCLAKKPSDRYESVAALGVALAPFAPPDALGIVARLERGLGPAQAVTTSEHAPATPHPEEPAPTPSTEGGSAALPNAQETFSALQSTMSQRSAARSPWWSAALAVLGIAAVGVAVRTMGRAPPDTGRSMPLATSGNLTTPPPDTTTGATTEVIASAPVVTAASPPSVRPVPSSSIFVRHATPVAPVAVASASASAILVVHDPAPATAAPPATASAATGPRKRTLDRDDP